MSDRTTLGVEEEFLLVDGEGRLAQEAPETLSAAEAGEDTDLKGELLRCQVESATSVHDDVDAVRADLTDLRSLLVDAARDRELRLIASGTVVHGQPDDSKIGPDTRYHRMVRRYGRMVYGGLTCGCHVHVGIADREQAIRVINRLRPWLPLLLAVSANSPFHEGRDTGYASSRYLLWSRWPTAGPPPPLESVEHYERVVRGMLATGAAMDRKMVYWDVRPSEHQDTVEFRVHDVCGTVEEAALLSVLARTLVDDAVERIGRGEPEGDPIPQEVLRGYLWQASRDGFEGECLDPAERAVRPVADIVGELVRRMPDEDRAFAEDVLGMLRTDGGGARRQRRVHDRREDYNDVVDFLATQTAP